MPCVVHTRLMFVIHETRVFILLLQVFHQVLAVPDMSSVPEEHDVRGKVQTLSVS